MRADGQYRILRTDGRPRFGPFGNFLGMLGVNVDVTEMRQAEAALREETSALEVAALDRVCPAVGYPKTIRVDQGSEFVSRDLDLWAYARGVTLDFSRPGKPTDNAFIEAFNGRFRAECLNAHWFLTLDDARAKMEEWRRYYNEDRPHGAIGNKCPISLQNPDGAPSPSS